MGLPNIEITFNALANSAIQRLSRGVVGVIIKDEQDNGACELLRASQITEKLDQLGVENQEYLRRAFIGYVTGPKKVIAYVLPQTATNLSEALDYMATQPVDYLVGPLDIEEPDIDEIKLWISDRRLAGATPKAVLPNTAADDYVIVNVTTEGIMVGNKMYTAAAYCSRIAGLIAGTPITVSCTYAPLPEVTQVAALEKEAMDDAIERGEFILFSDGAKVKVGRAVNSFQNLKQIPSMNDSFKKIKIVEAIDMLRGDIRMTAQDAYIGKYANSYDNKLLLVTAIRNYFANLEREGVLAAGQSTVEIDVDEQEKYLIGLGVDVSEMAEQDIKEANTGSKVFLAAKVSILDAIEDITLNITI
jgi:hypothetical protein